MGAISWPARPCLSERGNYDVWIMKLYGNGAVERQQRPGGLSNDYVRSIQQTSDGGYIVAGQTLSFGAGGDAWVLKLDANGNIFGCSGMMINDTSVTGVNTAATVTTSTAIPQDGALTVTDIDTIPAATAVSGVAVCTGSLVGTTTTVSPVTATFSTSNQTLTLSATVTPAGGTVNEGTVTFTVKKGLTVIGTTSGTVTNNTASASYTLPGGALAARI